MAVYDNAPGVTLTREQTAQLAYAAGARGDDLVFLTGVPQRESSYRPGVHRTDSARSSMTGDFGTWQINYTHFPALRQAGIIRSPQDLFDPAINAKAAVFLLRRDGRAPWTAGSGGWTAGGDANYGWNRAAAQAAVDNAASRGLLGQDYRTGATAQAAATGGGPAGASGPTVLPRDARLVTNTSTGSGNVWAFFQIGQGVWMRYQVTDPAAIGGRAVERLTTAQMNAKYGRTINGGDAEELKSIPTGFGTYGAFWNSIVDSVIGKTNPARNDPEVLAMLGEYAGRPDMTTAELQNKLQATKWFQSRTEQELEYNSLGAQEKIKRNEEMLARMNQANMEFRGGGPTGWTANQSHVIEVASGKISWNQWLETRLKPAALKVAESPWARTVRDMEEATRQRGIDTENTSQRVRDELERYGLQWDSNTMNRWATDLVEKRKSDEDLTAAMEQGAQALYPGLGPLNGQDVATLAAPWLETAERVLEKKFTLFDPKVRGALASGMGVWDFEKELTKSPEWMKTRNADERMNSFASQLNEEFGF
jgi:hypothetical protein